MKIYLNSLANIRKMIYICNAYIIKMISYKYKLYRTDKTKHLDRLLREGAFVWNRALAIQKRYYRLYHKYVSVVNMQKHFSKRYKFALLHSQSAQEIIQRLDIAYKRFFDHIAKRPPKFRKAIDFCSVVFKQGGYALNGNELVINKLKKKYKFSLSREYSGKIKRLTIKRNHLGEYFVIMCIDRETEKCGKSHNGASVGIDFGLKVYMTMSDGAEIENPQFLKSNLIELRRRSRNLSKCVKGSNNRKKKRLELDRLFNDISNKRSDFQWKLAHQLCRKYDNIFLEDLSLTGMTRRWGRKMGDLAHGDFVLKLEYIASKYGCTVHKIDRYFPSSRLCTCGYKNDKLTLKDREWTCPVCGQTHQRDLFAAQNILRQGIAELGSGSKSPRQSPRRSRVSHPRISSLQGVRVCQTDVYHDENGTVIPEKSFAPTAEDVEKLLSGSVEDSPSFAKLLNGEKQKHAGLSKSLEELLGVPVTVWVSLRTVDELNKD